VSCVVVIVILTLGVPPAGGELDDL